MEPGVRTEALNDGLVEVQRRVQTFEPRTWRDGPALPTRGWYVEVPVNIQIMKGDAGGV